jgi:hypothetical protein
MMRAFIVRPFGKKEGIDFDAVEQLLIQPALAAAGITGATTGEIARQGNIQQDVFRGTATGDLVIADISIHNANVFYELGVRHALRARHTFLLRARVHDVPFDLRGERYLEYDKDAPAAAVQALANALRATIDSRKPDSPVFRLLELDPTIFDADLARLLDLPADFREEVARAARDHRIGDLALLAEEARLLPWAREGLRVVGTAQFRLKSHEAARATWLAVRDYDATDLEANQRLATIYQKLEDLTQSDAAVDRVLGNRKQEMVRGSDLAELTSLRGSNMKTRWRAEWRTIAELAARRRAALTSPWLRRAFEEYDSAFTEDRNHFYSGLNALAMVTILLGLADMDEWKESHDSEEQAGAERSRLEKSRTMLIAAVELALKTAARTAAFSGERDIWLEISKADLAFASGELKPARIAQRYRDALAGAERFYLTAMRRQLEIFRDLDVHREAAVAALAVADELDRALPADPTAQVAPARILVFTGHRVDALGRKEPRFPRTEEAETKARQMIAAAIDSELADATGEVVGIAGGASGSDILFHELCLERGIKTTLFILSGRDPFVAKSVADSGPGWITRFDKLYRQLPARVLGDSDEPMMLPRWSRSLSTYSVWERNNRWTLQNALVYGAAKTTLIALWDQKTGDGPGGTEHMVRAASERGARVVILDAKKLLS